MHVDVATRLNGESAERDRLCACGQPRKLHGLRCTNKACAKQAVMTGAGSLECGYCAGPVDSFVFPLDGSEVVCPGYRGTNEFLTERSAGDAAKYKAAMESEKHAGR